MTLRTALVVAAAILVSLAAIYIGWKIGQSGTEPAVVTTTETLESEVVDGPTTTIQLFFPGPEGRLHTEPREIPVQADLLTHLKRVLEELLAGPETEALFSALPPEITLSWIHLNESGLVYVDLDFSGEGEFPAWGSRHERVAVFSVVNSLFANTPEIDSVVLLRNGQQRPTFAGHLDTSRPLLANRQLIADPQDLPDGVPLE